MDYVITPRVPGVRPADPPDYDGITFVYVFTQILDPWVVPAVGGQVTLVVANAQGFVPGMTIVLENAGYFEVVSTTALDRMTVQNFGTNYNQPPGTGIAPGKVTTTSLPGPPGGTGPVGPPGPPGTQGPVGPPLNVKGTVASAAALPPTGNTINDMWVALADGHGYAWAGTQWLDLGPYQGPSGPTGMQGPAGPQGVQGTQGPIGNQGPAGPVGPQGPTGVTGPTGQTGLQGSVGATGATGPQGPGGPQGPQGPQGATGPQGSPGAPGGASANTTLSAVFTMPAVNGTAVASVVNAGAFSVGGVVYINPVGYLNVQAVNTGTNQLTLQNLGYASNQSPGSTAPSGSAVTGVGPQGPAGPQGPTGATGTTGAQGATGPQGATGSQGPQGPIGNTGAQGPAGTAATVAVGTTTTGAAGSNASVTNSGTTSAAVFNFTVPQGVQGIQGTQGAAGATGATGAQGAQGPQGVQGVTGPTGAAGATGPQGLQGNTGATGPQGPAGPSAVSADAGNIATLGSDSLILVPQSTIWSALLRRFNAIGNPSFEVDQRNVGNPVVNPSAGTMIIDRWAKSGGGTYTVNCRQINPTVVPVVPGTNFQISSKIFQVNLQTTQATLAAGDFLSIRQNCEGISLRELINDVHSMSLLVQSTVAPLSFSVALRDAGQTRSLVKLCTISTVNTWILFTLPNLPIWPSAGSFNITPGLQGYFLEITLACGSNLIAPAADTWQNGTFMGAPGMSNFCNNVVNSGFQIAFIQHEPGPLCTTLIDKPWQQNYDECLRYYQKSYSYPVLTGTVDGNGQLFMPVFSGVTAVWGPIGFKRTMAKAPTVSARSPNTGAGNAVRNVTSGADVAVSSTQSPGDAGFGGFNLGQAPGANSNVSFHYIADTGW